jgi:hypothetical protein
MGGVCSKTNKVDKGTTGVSKSTAVTDEFPGFLNYFFYSFVLLSRINRQRIIN